ncbi:peptidase M15 [Neorhizobium lilium]|uniref:Peptidase M15 n=1 Tax=Neorhizobium lilium TaxID=2503024 RepID=A0A444LI24_9HYPH|nr:D-alanyl-D-alanine carboxypeptidase [Neorhizobium lilium]RWX78710.1 peptidase M15 [Neorhizobium lilium]
MFRFARVLAFLILAGSGLAAGKTEAQAGYAHFIYDATTGKVLTSENADVINHPASLTKMMTLYITFEALRQRKISWDDQIVMTQNAASKIPFKLGVRPGQPITVREAVYGMAIRSANDAAAAMADHLGGSEDRFGSMMTAKARTLGMSQTVFRNASGLPDDAQVTSARDMATLAMALIRDYPEEYKIFSMRSFQFRGKKIPGHNNLMYRYPGMDGVKTGFVNASGFNIASAVTINGHRIIGVIMGGKSARKRDDQMAALLDQYAAGGGSMVAKAPQTVQPDTSLPANQPPGVAVAAAPAARPAPDGAKVLSFAAPRKEIMLGSPPVTASLGDLDSQARNIRAAEWRIQIAAAGTQEAALALLQRAMPILSGSYAQASPSVEGYTDAGREYYRARFAGFASKDAASGACALLKAKSVNCVVVR